jgi:hypothetical protein
MSSTFQKESSHKTPPTSRPPYPKRLARFRKQGKGWWLLALLIILVFLAGGAVLLLSSTPTTGAAGRVSAALSTHDFGTIKIKGGFINTRFPLVVEEGTVVVQSLGTT